MSISPVAEQYLYFTYDAMPSGIETTLRYSDLLPRYAATSWGQEQAASPLRYTAHYGYDRATMLADLGDDVHPLGHMGVVHNDVCGFGIDQCFMGESSPLRDVHPTDIAAVRTAAFLHDVGESAHPDLVTLCGATVGDIPYGEKTASDRAAEQQVLQKILNTLYADLPDSFRERIVAIITHQEDSPVHTLLEVAHTWGAYATGIMAGRVALSAAGKELAPDANRQENLTRLAKDVTARLRPLLEQHIEDFPLLDKFLNGHAALENRIATEL